MKRDERDYCPKEMKMEGSCPLGHRCDVSIFASYLIRILVDIFRSDVVTKTFLSLILIG